ncbi:hypothetical protein SLEP1_g22623 [Rubroshorea leprosula]|uniref:Secreted protein n=1 Tax=Rubroshorea leprosula TaxID=152421 RepID=A0AAV5J9R8_9ROSI|nr:hypothetical protein SLEP1_g22623 [Rubroshorea leprosula]
MESWWGICLALACVKPFTSLDGPQFEFWGQNSFLGGTRAPLLFLFAPAPSNKSPKPNAPSLEKNRNPGSALLYLSLPAAPALWGRIALIFSVSHSHELNLFSLI